MLQVYVDEGRDIHVVTGLIIAIKLGAVISISLAALLVWVGLVGNSCAVVAIVMVLVWEGYVGIIVLFWLLLLDLFIVWV